MEIITKNQKYARLHGLECNEVLDPSITFWDLPAESVLSITIGGSSENPSPIVVDLDELDYVVINGYITLKEKKNNNRRNHND